MTAFTATERTIIAEAIRTGAAPARPPWMDSARFRALKREVEQTRPATTRAGGAVEGRYHAERRCKWFGNGYATHEAGTDGLPICRHRDGFAPYPGAIEQLGPGAVSCGHCENDR